MYRIVLDSTNHVSSKSLENRPCACAVERHNKQYPVTITTNYVAIVSNFWADSSTCHSWMMLLTWHTWRILSDYQVKRPAHNNGKVCCSLLMTIKRSGWFKHWLDGGGDVSLVPRPHGRREHGLGMRLLQNYFSNSYLETFKQYTYLNI